LKYLLQGISENRAKTSLSDRELRNLLLDVKPHKSKWANEDRIGQEDLYEACEKVLIDLKNYSVRIYK
jgi:transcriptional activator SPT7